MFWNKKTELEKAILDSNLEIVRKEIASGADLNAILKKNSRYLFMPIETNNLDLLKTFLLCQIDLETRDGSNRTPLYIAAYSGYVQMVEVLLQAGANPDVPCGLERQNALYSAIEGFDSKAYTQIEVLRSIVNMMLKHGANPNYSLTTGVSIFHAILFTDDPILIQHFINLGVDLNAMAGSTPPIAIAVRQGKPETVEQLIQAGARVDIKFPNGITLSDMARVRGDKRIIEAISKILSKS